MIEPVGKRHGLESFADAAAPTNAGIDLVIRTDLGHVNLRGDLGNPVFRKAANDVLGQALPAASNTLSTGDHQVFWLGPDEWLILCKAEATTTLARSLEDAFAGLHTAVNILSGGQLALQVTGDTSRQVFARGCTIDFHRDKFSKNMCVQTGLAKASVLIGQVDEPDSFIIVVRRSFSDYLVRWIAHAGAETGVRVNTSQ